MSDITKCEGNGCPYRTHCYRYTATANEHMQAWFTDEIIWKTEDGKIVCDNYSGHNYKKYQSKGILEDGK